MLQTTWKGPQHLLYTSFFFVSFSPHPRLPQVKSFCIGLSLARVMPRWHCLKQNDLFVNNGLLYTTAHWPVWHESVHILLSGLVSIWLHSADWDGPWTILQYVSCIKQDFCMIPVTFGHLVVEFFYLPTMYWYSYAIILVTFMNVFGQMVISATESKSFNVYTVALGQCTLKCTRWEYNWAKHQDPMSMKKTGVKYHDKSKFWITMQI